MKTGVQNLTRGFFVLTALLSIAHARAFWTTSIATAPHELPASDSSLFDFVRTAAAPAPSRIKFAVYGGEATLYVNGQMMKAGSGLTNKVDVALKDNDVVAFECRKTRSQKVGFMATIAYNGKLYRTGINRFTTREGFSKWNKWEQQGWNAVKQMNDNRSGKKHDFCHWKKADRIKMSMTKFDKKAAFIWRLTGKTNKALADTVFIRFVVGGEKCPKKESKSDKSDQRGSGKKNKGKSTENEDDESDDEKKNMKKSPKSDDDDDDKKGKKKGSKGSDDEDDDDDKKGKKKGSKGNDDDDDDDDKKGKKKGSKGSDDDDDDDDKKGKKKSFKGDDDDDDDDKKSKKKGSKGDDDDDADEDKKSKKKGSKGDGDDDADEDKKSKKKSFKGDVDDDDGDNKKSKKQSSDDDDDDDDDDDKKPRTGRVPHPKDGGEEKTDKTDSYYNVGGQNDDGKPDGFCACKLSTTRGGECYDMEDPTASSGRCKPRLCEPKFECVASSETMCVKRRGGSKVVLVSPNNCKVESADNMEMLLPYEG